MKSIIVCLFACIMLVTSTAQIQIGQDIEGNEVGEISGTSISMSANGKRVAIGAPWNSSNGLRSGQVKIFEEVNGSWLQIGQNINGDTVEDELGTSVSISADGKRVAVGAPLNSQPGTFSFDGYVKILEEINGTWVQIGQNIVGEDVDNFSGWSVSISDNGQRVAIGAPRNDGTGTDAGHVRVFQESNGTWTQIGLDIDGENPYDETGYSVSISGDGTIVAIGAPKNIGNGNGSNTGHTRIFQEINGSWSQMGLDIDGDNSAAFDNSGFSVSLSNDGTSVAIGNPKHNYAGQAKVFQYINGSWVQIGQNIPGAVLNEEAGYSVSISGDGKKVGVSSWSSSTNGYLSGHMRMFEEINSTWTQIGQEIKGDAAYDRFGYCVSLSSDGSRVASSAIYNANNGMETGHTKVFGVASPTSISEITAPQIFRLFPNPTKDQFSIDLKKNYKQATVTISDIAGHVLEVIEYDNVSDVSAKLNEAGVYMVRVDTDSGRSMSFKVVCGL